MDIQMLKYTVVLSSQGDTITIMCKAS